MSFKLTLFYPQDVPYILNLEWSMNSRLKNLVQQFEEVFVSTFLNPIQFPFCFKSHFGSMAYFITIW